MKPYPVTKHAIDRVVERLSIPRHQAESYLRQLMQTAEYQGVVHNVHGNATKIYDHHKSRVRICLVEEKIVTCYKMNEALATLSGDVSLPAELLTELKRKAGAFLRKYTRRNRELERAIIEAKIAVLENERKKLRVNNPATKAVIDVKISDIQTQLDAMKAEQRELASKIAEVSAHV